MTTFNDVVDRIIKQAAASKESLLSGMRPSMIATRAGQPQVLTTHDSMDQLLAASGPISSAYGADALAMVFEGIFPLVDTNPLTGEDWQPGEPESVWRDSNGVAEGWVTECQLITIATRDSKVVSFARPFQHVGDQILWEERQEIPATGLNNALVESFDVPVIDTDQIADPANNGNTALGMAFLSPAEGRRFVDIEMTSMVQTRFTEEHPGGGILLILPDAAAAVPYLAEGLKQANITYRR